MLQFGIFTFKNPIEIKTYTPIKISLRKPNTRPVEDIRDGLQRLGDRCRPALQLQRGTSADAAATARNGGVAQGAKEHGRSVGRTGDSIQGR